MTVSVLPQLTLNNWIILRQMLFFPFSFSFPVAQSSHGFLSFAFVVVGLRFARIVLNILFLIDYNLKYDECKMLARLFLPFRYFSSLFLMQRVAYDSSTESREGLRGPKASW